MLLGLIGTVALGLVAIPMFAGNYLPLAIFVVVLIVALPILELRDGPKRAPRGWDRRF